MALSLGEIRWLAGLLEGEGCFGIYFNKNAKGEKKYPVLRISLGMTDEDVVERAAGLLGARGHRTYQPAKGIKPFFETTVTGSRAAGWMMTLYSLMGRRRRQRILECLSRWDGPRRRRFSRNPNQPCRRGHIGFFDRYHGNGYLFCRECAKEDRTRRTERERHRLTGNH